MTESQWESLCDGCGKCCLHKLEDEDDGRVHYTRVACKMLDISRCRCNDYENRLSHVPDCTVLTPDTVAAFSWLPSTCAYRLIDEGKPLFKWHPLISKKKLSTVKKGKSVSGFAISELVVDEDEFEDHIVRWVQL